MNFWKQCLIVEDPEKPEQSLRNANIKCWFSEKEFNAFIPYATDVSRGLFIDDGIGYTNADGAPYDALPEGNYTAAAVLLDGKGHELASAEKAFAISPAQNVILCRFHPDDHYERMMSFAEENHLSMNIDYLPGYLKDRKGNDRGGLRAMFIGGDAALYKGSHVTMFEYLAAEDSSSLTFESQESVCLPAKQRAESPLAVFDSAGIRQFCSHFRARSQASHRQEQPLL